MSRAKKDERANLGRWLAVLAVMGLLIVTAYFLAAHLEEKNRVQERGVMQEGFGQRKRVEYQGKAYVQKTGLTAMLLMGVDRAAGSRSYGARQGGQADFLLVMVLDPGDRTIRQLQIDRDTMAEVATLGVLGNVVGTKNMQICLSHGFGANDEENCEYTLKAVQNLLEGERISLYAAFKLDSIGVLNDALGGVMVTLEEDFAVYDPLMKRGTTLRLTGEQARLFVRYRMEVGDGSNQSRMKRQRTYMSGVHDALREQMSRSTAFVGGLYDALGDMMTTNISKGRMINEANKAQGYEVMPVETLAGEYQIGEDGFMEFHPAQGEALRWVIDTVYEPL